MKKNVVGHMMARKETVSGRLRRWHILPKLLCLLVALVLWLVIVNLQDTPQPAQDALQSFDVAFTDQI